MRTDLVDRLTAIAADADAPPLDDLAAHRMVERALLGAALASPEPHRVPRWLLAPALACAALLAYFALRTQPAPEQDLLRITLPTGDKLVGTHGARFDIAELAPDARRFTVHRGTMLFDVAKLTTTQRFEVVTSHVVVVARGTVFSVTPLVSSTQVHVYEGTVDIVHETVTTLVAGESWSSASSKVRVRDASRVIEAATAAVRARSELAAATPVESSAPRSTSNPATSSPATSNPATSSPATSDTATSNLATSNTATSNTATSNTATSNTATSDTATSNTALPTAARPTTARPTTTRPTTARSTTARSTPDDDDTVDNLLASARVHVSSRKFDAALEIIRAAKAQGATGGAWHLVEGDAYRGLARTSEAADAFEAAARVLVGDASIEAAFTAAYLRFHTLHDGAGALAALELADVERAGSPLEERGLALRVRVLVALGRREQAIAAAQRYLERFPNGGMRAYMTATAGRGT